MLLQMAKFPSFYRLVVFHCTCIPHLYPFICWWTLRLHPYPGNGKQCCSKQCSACIFPSLIYFRYILHTVLNFSWLLVTLPVGCADLNVYYILLRIIFRVNKYSNLLKLLLDSYELYPYASVTSWNPLLPGGGEAFQCLWHGIWVLNF